MHVRLANRRPRLIERDPLSFESLEMRRLMAVDLLADLDLEPNNFFSPRDVTEFRSGVIFRGSDGEIGPEPWVSDGTAASTELLKDINVGRFGSGPRDFTFYNGSYYFGANNGFNGYELWVTEGTRGSTQLVADIWPGAESGALSEITLLGGQMFFFANDGETGRELYRSDGTAIGTERVVDAVPGRPGLSGETLTLAGDRIFFVAVPNASESDQAGLWVTDGTEPGTNLVAIDGVDAARIEQLTPFGNQLLFVSAGKVWITDGTAAGSRQIGLDVGSEINGIAVARNQVFVSTSTGLHVLDSGLSESTSLVSSSQGVTSSADTIYYWNSSGLNSVPVGNASTSLVRFVSFFGTQMGGTWQVPGGMAFHINRTLDQYEVWVTDGSVAGTQLLDKVTDVSSEPLAGFRQVGTGIYFAATNGLLRESLWRVEAPILEVPEPPATPGDVTGDDTVDVADVDAIFAAVAIGANNSAFDLNADGLLSSSDAYYLVEEIVGTKSGDLNLNGRIDFADFLILSANFGKQEVDGWAAGDLTGDGAVSFPDFLLLSANFGFAKPATAASLSGLLPNDDTDDSENANHAW